MVIIVGFGPADSGSTPGGAIPFMGNSLKVLLFVYAPLSGLYMVDLGGKNFNRGSAPLSFVSTGGDIISALGFSNLQIGAIYAPTFMKLHTKIKVR